MNHTLKVFEREEIPFMLESSFFPQLAEEMGPGRMLDLGCSTGKVMKIFHRYGWVCVGVDIDATALRIASQYGKVIHRKNEEQLSDLEDNSFDLICAQAVFHHLKDVDGNLLELIRCAKPGALMLINEVVEDSLFLRLGRNLFNDWEGMPIYSRLYVCDWLEIFQQYNLNLLHTYGQGQWVGLASALIYYLPGRFQKALSKLEKHKKLALTSKGFGRVHYILFVLQKPK